VPMIDCDVHPMINDASALLPYMPRAGQQRFADEGLSVSARIGGRYPHPTGHLRKDATPPGGGLPASDPVFTAEHLLDPNDMEMALLEPLQAAAVAVWTDPARADVFASACNSYFVEHWCGADPRYGLCITASPHDPALAAAEIRRNADVKGVLAVQLPLTDILMGDKHYFPIYEAAEEVGMPIIVHPTGGEGSFTRAPTIAGGVPRSYAERHVLLPQVGQSNLASLVFNGVFDHFPKLRVAFVEWGFSWLLPFLWRMDKEWRNFRADLPWLERPPSEIVREHVRFSTQPIDEPAHHRDLWPVLELLRASELLMFSSDYPHYDNDSPMKVANSLLPKEGREAILYGNAKEFFRGRL
jgi:predicted TIM-barrel fold metal-dependent hydrolase